MHIAITGATGFLGRYIVNLLLEQGHTCRCWHRPQSDRGGFVNDGKDIQWLPGALNDADATQQLVKGVDAVVHSALERSGTGFVGGEGELLTFAERNILGSLRLMQAARQADVARFIFISTCAVHDLILSDRQLDEAHPLWPKSHYGAHKAAIEKFVHSFGLGEGWPICALRPTGIYGLARPKEKSRWHRIVQSIKRGEDFAGERGGKEVHAADVAKATALLLHADEKSIIGQAFNCYDRYIAEQDVAELAKQITGSASRVEKRNVGPKNQIDTTRIRTLGMSFGGEALLRQTIEQMLD